MNVTTDPPSSVASAVELVALDRRECLRLLAGGSIGRVVFTEGALPAVQPVSYLLDGEEVVFRTDVGSTLAVATRHAVVAFQVDEIDLAAETGWSVLGVGESYEITDPARLEPLSGRLPVPWVPSGTAHAISIPLQRLTGRRLERHRVEQPGDGENAADGDTAA